MMEHQQIAAYEVASQVEAIEARNLGKRYGNGVQALRGLSFSVRHGEIFGLLGPNGAGKSTTVRILATLTQPDEGEATVAGYDVVREARDVRHRIGYVAQASGVDKYATGRENLALQAQLQRVSRETRLERVNSLLALLGLDEAADRIVNTYSGGMQRRLDIAMGLVHEPAVLFLDEPTTGLDPETRRTLWEDLVRLRKERQLTVLLTTHYLEEADRLCDRVAIIDRGQLVAQGTPPELKAQIQGDMVALEVDTQSKRAAEQLRAATGVREVLANGNSVIARVDNGASVLPGLITVLERADVKVVSATLSQPSLDDVYLQHTGRRFDAAGEENSPSQSNTHKTRGDRQ